MHFALKVNQLVTAWSLAEVLDYLYKFHITMRETCIFYVNYIFYMIICFWENLEKLLEI